MCRGLGHCYYVLEVSAFSAFVITIGVSCALGVLGESRRVRNVEGHTNKRRWQKMRFGVEALFCSGSFPLSKRGFRVQCRAHKALLAKAGGKSCPGKFKHGLKTLPETALNLVWAMHTARWHSNLELKPRPFEIEIEGLGLRTRAKTQNPRP